MLMLRILLSPRLSGTERSVENDQPYNSTTVTLTQTSATQRNSDPTRQPNPNLNTTNPQHDAFFEPSPSP